MSLKGIKLITFDATNTLLKFRVPPWKHYASVGREHGFNGTDENIKHRMLESYKSMWQAHPNFGRNTIYWEEWWRRVVKSTFKGFLHTEADENRVADRLIEEFRTSKCWIPAKGGEELLKLITEKGICVGVISNFDPRLNDILEDVSILHNINFILTSYEIGFSKPDKRIFKMAIERCGKVVEPSQSLHIGDDVEKDYIGARAAGWHALLITENHNETPPALGHVFNSLEDLIAAVKEDKLRL